MGGSGNDIFIFWMAISGIKNFEFCVITILYRQFTPFTDMLEIVRVSIRPYPLNILYSHEK